LLSLHIDIEHRYFYAKHAPAKLYEPVVFALKELVQSCTKLETVGIPQVVKLRVLDKDGTVNRLDDWPGVEEDIELDLKVVPLYHRDDVTVVWCRTTIRVYIEDGPTIRIVSPEEYEKMGFYYPDPDCKVAWW
jgi:hypothetical protein